MVQKTQLCTADNCIFHNRTPSEQCQRASAQQLSSKSLFGASDLTPWNIKIATRSELNLCGSNTLHSGWHFIKLNHLNGAAEYPIVMANEPKNSVSTLIPLTLMLSMLLGAEPRRYWLYDPIDPFSSLCGVDYRNLDTVRPVEEPSEWGDELSGILTLSLAIGDRWEIGERCVALQGFSFCESFFANSVWKIQVSINVLLVIQLCSWERRNLSQLGRRKSRKFKNKSMRCYLCREKVWRKWGTKTRTVLVLCSISSR